MSVYAFQVASHCISLYCVAPHPTSQISDFQASLALISSVCSLL